jgi:hypothetical protein
MLKKPLPREKTDEPRPGRADSPDNHSIKETVMADASMNDEARGNRVQELRTALEEECGSFGIVTWGDSDIVTALTERGIYPTPDKIAAVRENYFVCHMDDEMTLSGWGAIHAAIDALELTPSPLREFKPALSRMYETYGKDWEHIKSLDEHRVATLVDAGEKEALLTGIHYVNRIGYYILSSPWTQEGEIADRADDSESRS